MTKSTSRTRIDPQKFVTLWMNKIPVDTLATELGCSVPRVRALAVKLRKAGVKLPRYKKAGQAFDVEGLNKIIVAAKSGRPSIMKLGAKAKIAQPPYSAKRKRKTAKK